MRNLEKANIMIWSSYMDSIDCLLSLNLGGRFYQLRVKEANYEDNCCLEFDPDRRDDAAWPEIVAWSENSTEKMDDGKTDGHLQNLSSLFL